TGVLLEGGAEGAPLEAVADAAAQEADLTLRLHEPSLRLLGEQGLSEVYQHTELPLVEVLADMERAGVKVNPAFLAEMSAEMEQQLEQLTREIYALAGQEFNIQSPIQLRDVLFAKLGMKS